MTMTTNKNHNSPNVPNLRFPEFQGEWEMIKVSDLLDFYSTNSLSWEQLDYNNGKIKNLHYGLIHKGLPTMVDVAYDSLPYIKEEFMLKSFTLLKEGDVAFADASEDTNDVAKAIEAVNCNNQQIVSGLHTIHGRDNSNRTVIGYKGYAFASDSFHKQIRRIAQGTKVFSISVRNFDEVYIGIPSKEEQTKISKLLTAIDKRIATQNKIIEDLKKLKSAIIEKLYSKIQGKEYSYGQLFEVINERNKQMEYSNILAASQEKGMVNRDDLNLDIQFERSNIDIYKIVRKGDYVIHLRSFQGGFAFSNMTGVCSPAYTILRPSTLLEYGYLSYYFKSYRFIKSLIIVTYGIRDGRSISVEEWLNLKISIPSKEHQLHILKVLRSFDLKIENEETYASCLSNQKQYLLRQMFI